MPNPANQNQPASLPSQPDEIHPLEETPADAKEALGMVSLYELMQCSQSLFEQEQCRQSNAEVAIVREWLSGNIRAFWPVEGQYHCLPCVYIESKQCCTQAVGVIDVEAGQTVLFEAPKWLDKYGAFTVSESGEWCLALCEHALDALNLEDGMDMRFEVNIEAVWKGAGFFNPLKLCFEVSRKSPYGYMLYDVSSLDFVHFGTKEVREVVQRILELDQSLAGPNKLSGPLKSAKDFLETGLMSLFMYGSWVNSDASTQTVSQNFNASVNGLPSNFKKLLHFCEADVLAKLPDSCRERVVSYLSGERSWRAIDGLFGLLEQSSEKAKVHDGLAKSFADKNMQLLNKIYTPKVIEFCDADWAVVQKATKVPLSEDDKCFISAYCNKFFYIRNNEYVLSHNKYLRSFVRNLKKDLSNVIMAVGAMRRDADPTGGRDAVIRDASSRMVTMEFGELFFSEDAGGNRFIQKTLKEYMRETGGKRSKAAAFGEIRRYVSTTFLNQCLLNNFISITKLKANWQSGVECSDMDLLTDLIALYSSVLSLETSDRRGPKPNHALKILLGKMWLVTSNQWEPRTSDALKPVMVDSKTVGFAGAVLGLMLQKYKSEYGGIPPFLQMEISEKALRAQLYRSEQVVMSDGFDDRALFVKQKL